MVPEFASRSHPGTQTTTLRNDVVLPCTGHSDSLSFYAVPFIGSSPGTRLGPNAIVGEYLGEDNFRPVVESTMG